MSATVPRPSDRPAVAAHVALQRSVADELDSQMTRPSRRRLLGLPLALALGACSAHSVPRWNDDVAWPSPAAQAIGQRVQLEVIDRDTGAVLPLHRARDAVWVAGRPGAHYGLRVVNRTSERVLLVMSVDGVNVLSGETADWSQGGYVLAPGERARIDGWRKSPSEIAAFRFSAAGDSYAARTGRPLDVGVIGVAVFREARSVAYRPSPPPAVWPRPAPFGERERASTAERKTELAAPETSAAPRAGAAVSADEAMVKAVPPESNAMADRADGRQKSREQARPSEAPEMTSRRRPPAAEPKLGTAHGRRETSVISTIHFERASAEPIEVLALRYDSRANLVRLGVIDAPWLGRSLSPRPFPDQPQPGYVPDPPVR